MICDTEKTQQQLVLVGLAEGLGGGPSLNQKSQPQESISLTPEAAREKKRKYHREYYRVYRAKYPERHRAAVRRCKEKHREAHAARRRELYRLNREKILAVVGARNRTRKYRDRANAYLRRRRREHPQFLLADRLRASANRAFRRNWIKKPARTEALLGCTIAEAKAHIEAQFVNGMSWKDRASFVIDHVVPVVAFDLRDAEEVKWAFNWRNLQPITPHQNAVKSDTIPSPLPSWLPPHIAQRILARQVITASTSS